MLHRPAEEAGVYYLAIMAGVPFGSFAASRLARRMPLGRLLRLTNATAIAGAAILLAITISGHLSVPGVILPMLVYSVGVGATSPIALTSAISAQPMMIGAASGLYGFSQMTFGALCTLAVGFWSGNPALTASIVLLCATVAGQIAFAAAGKARTA